MARMSETRVLYTKLAPRSHRSTPMLPDRNELVGHVDHAPGREELVPFFDVNGSPSPRGGDQEISLAAQEGRYLHEVCGFCCRRTLLWRVNIVENPIHVLEKVLRSFRCSRACVETTLYGLDRSSLASLSVRRKERAAFPL
jgi:hypothetical protein